jgi:hypothetical protein
MATFAIKAVHDAGHEDSRRMRDCLGRAGVHFLTHAKWGCSEGDHSAWLLVEADCEDDVRLMVPPVLRRSSTVIRISE